MFLFTISFFLWSMQLVNLCVSLLGCYRFKHLNKLQRRSIRLVYLNWLPMFVWFEFYVLFIREKVINICIFHVNFDIRNKKGWIWMAKGFEGCAQISLFLSLYLFFCGHIHKLHVGKKCFISSLSFTHTRLFHHIQIWYDLFRFAQF